MIRELLDRNDWIGAVGNMAPAYLKQCLEASHSQIRYT